jgi:hypothetical protein
MLFNGSGSSVRPRAADVADAGAGQRGRGRIWIKDSYKTAMAKASDDDRAMALQMLERWVQGRRD